MKTAQQYSLARMLLAAPFIFILHFWEEAPGFVAWFNAHVARGINIDTFWLVNFFGLAITIIVVGAYWLARTGAALGFAVAWFSFLMFANALLHLGGYLLDGSYVPGLLTALLLYLPYYFFVLLKIFRSRQLQPYFIFTAALLGAIPMCIHGYRILFLGSRLF